MFRVVRRQPLILLQQRVPVFRTPGVTDDAIDRTDHDALGLIVVSHAFGTTSPINLEYLHAHGDRFVRTLRRTQVTVDAVIGDLERHDGDRCYQRPSDAALRISASSTTGATNFDTSPPSNAISRTIPDEMKLNWASGVRKTDSTSSAIWRLIVAN